MRIGMAGSEAGHDKASDRVLFERPQLAYGKGAQMEVLLMSRWKFKNVQKAQTEVILYFDDTTQPLWGSTMSVTIPAADAQKLLTKLQDTLHPGKHP